MATIRLILELDATPKPLTPALASEMWDERQSPQLLTDLRHEQALEEALQHRPDLLRAIWLRDVLDYLDSQGNAEAVALLKHAYPEVAVEELLPLLDQASRTYFLEQQGGTGAVGALAVMARSVRLRRVLVEDEQGPLATSDTRPGAAKRKK